MRKRLHILCIFIFWLIPPVLQSGHQISQVVSQKSEPALQASQVVSQKSESAFQASQMVSQKSESALQASQVASQKSQSALQTSQAVSQRSQSASQVSQIASRVFQEKSSASKRPSLLNGATENSVPEKAALFPNVLQQVMPAVVNIIVQGQLSPSSVVPSLSDQPSESPSQPTMPFGGNGPKFNSVGSGVIVDAQKGYLITNAHLLQKARTIVVMLSDGRKLRANKIGVDSATDLAVLQVEANRLAAIPFADAHELKVGDFVAAIGNPFGLHHTVTSGVVSALNRSHIIERPQGFENFIQTDASINPGNSGGALINRKGELVGINTAIVGPISGNVGIGFAIPIDMVHPIMQQLVRHGKINRGMLGVAVQDFTPSLADAFHMPNITGGALVTEVKPGSAAEKAGLKMKDVILKINQTSIHNAAQLSALVAVHPKGSHLNLTIRRGPQTKVVKVIIARLPDNLPQQKNPLSGVQLQNYDAYALATGELKGVEVTYVDDTSDAWIAGLRPGDILLSAYGEAIETIPNLLQLVKKNKDKPLLVNVWRSGGHLFFVVP